MQVLHFKKHALMANVKLPYFNGPLSISTTLQLSFPFSSKNPQNQKDSPSIPRKSLQWQIKNTSLVQFKLDGYFKKYLLTHIFFAQKYISS